MSPPHAFRLSRVLHSFGNADRGVRHTAAMILGAKGRRMGNKATPPTPDHSSHLSVQQNASKTNIIKSSQLAPTHCPLGPGRLPLLADDSNHDERGLSSLKTVSTSNKASGIAFQRLWSESTGHWEPGQNGPLLWHKGGSEA